ncbi:MAG: TldD/PmbA family protein [Candidatus Krumholzibacteriota bacterium]|nr:TldD/PmbA family protein [Candidatus Krumholzibacteriota bacterium]
MEERIYRILDMASSGGYECEVYGEDTDSYQVEIYRGQIESIDRSRDCGIGIRLVREGRIGYSYSNELSDQGLESALEEAKNNAAGSSAMDKDVLADNSALPVTRTAADEPCPEVESAFKIEGVRKMEEAALGFGEVIVNTEGAGYSEVSSEVFVASTRGFLRREKRSCCSCSIAAVAGKNDEIRSGWYLAQAVDPLALDFAAVGREAAVRASSLLDCQPIETGRYSVILDGSAFYEIIYLLEQALSAEMVVKGTSVFTGKQDLRIAPDIFSLVDDPFMPGGCFNASFDDEGVPRKKYFLVEGGILRGYFHNSYSARKMGTEPTANAVRSSFKSLPLPGATNLFVIPGKRDLPEILADLEDGLYVQNLMGMHTADSMSGDFSVGVNGYHIRSGQIKHAICEMTLSGNILDLLGGIREIGKKIVFIGSYGSPSVLLEDLSVSGK